MEIEAPLPDTGGVMQGVGGGPKTAEGKAVVARNAEKHGIMSAHPVVSEFESLSAWQLFRDGIVAALAVMDALEQALAEEAAALLWRLKRVSRFESGEIVSALYDMPSDYQAAKRFRGEVVRESEAKAAEFARALERKVLPVERAMEKVVRYEGHIHNQLRSVLREIREMQKHRMDRPGSAWMEVPSNATSTRAVGPGSRN